MSYYNNHNNQYSPYFQQTPEQEGRGAYSNPLPRNTAPNQYNTYQPLSAYQSGQQQQQQQPPQQQAWQHLHAPHATSRATTSYGNHGYAAGSATGSQQPQDRRSDGRPELDTTALGSLAYASSLGRDQNQAQQNANYNRPSTAGAYGAAETHATNSATPVSVAPPRTYSRGATVDVVNEQALQSPTYPPASNGRTSYYEHPYNFQRPGLQVVTSPVVTSAQTNPHQPAFSQSGNERNSTSKTPTGFRPTSSTPTPHPQQPGSPPAFSDRNGSANVDQGGTPARSSSALQVSSASQVNKQTNDRTTHQRQRSIPVGSQHPTTVDPNQIFDHYEHQKRQAVAAASANAEAEVAKRKATEAVSPKKRQPSAPKSANGSRSGEERSHSVSSQPNDVLQAARAALGSPMANPDSAKKEQMELEMKQMIEKMRDYKAKEPSLFSQVWEQVKKGQPLPHTNLPSAVQTSSDSHTTTNGQVQSPTQHPQEAILPAALSFPEGFDRGRFPHQRRRRGARQGSAPRKNGTPTNINQPESATPVSYTHWPASNNGPTASSTPTPAPPTAHDSDPENERLQKALQEFNKSSEPPISQPVAQSQRRENHTNTPTSASAPLVKTYWPAHRKHALADAARAALNSTFSNKGKTISSDEIITLLDQDPSYSEMCQTFEEKGFVIDRGHLARLLLAAVPDMLGPHKEATNASAPAGIPPPPPEQSLPQPPPYRRPNGYVTPYDSAYGPMPQEAIQQQHSVPQGIARSNLRWREDGNMNREKLIRTQRLDARGKIVGPPIGVYTPHTTHLPHTAHLAPSVPIANMLPPPQAKSTKENNARKRSYGEIVDLTQDISDEEFERRRPKPRIDYIHHGQFLDPATSGPPSSIATSGSGAEQTRNLDQFRYKSSTGKEHLWSEKMIEPMNKRKDALRRSTYNPKTIARDILLASGRHPTMAPLNQHLEILREKFQSVTWDSDLSTFRWDLVDPGGDLSRPRQRLATYQPPAISVPVLPVTDVNNDADDEDGDLSAERPNLRRGGRPRINLAIGNRSAPPAASGMGVLVPHQRPSQKSVTMVRNSTINTGTSFTPAARSIVSPVSTPPTHKFSSNTAANTPTPGRKGRPPGAKNKYPRPDKGIPKKKALSDRSLNRAGSGKSPVPARLHVSTSTPVKPSGLRNARTLEHGVAVVIQSRSPSVADPGSAQGDKRNWSTIKEGFSGINPSTPFYKVYKCKWDKCPAELHNLDTLRKHVRKHRDHGEGPFLCKWADCYNTQPLNDREKPSNGDGMLEWPNFASEETWDKHVESKHVSLYAWQLGDGPATHSSDVESSDYLSDSLRGRNQSPRVGRTISPRENVTIRPQIIVPLGTSNASSVASGAPNKSNDKTGQV